MGQQFHKHILKVLETSVIFHIHFVGEKNGRKLNNCVYNYPSSGVPLSRYKKVDLERDQPVA